MPDTATTPPRFTHLISDCDGVLIDSEAVALQALLELLGPRLSNLPATRLPVVVWPGTKPH